MADFEVKSVDSFTPDVEQIEKAISRVRFSEDASANEYIEPLHDADESDVVFDNSTDNVLGNYSSMSDSDVSSDKSDEELSVSSILRSATVAAVTNYSESSDDDMSAEHSESHMGQKSQSSPEITSTYKAEMEKLLATHMDVTCVLDRLYLSDYVSLSASRLAELGVTLVVNATYEMPNVAVPEGTVEFIKLHINDVVTANMAQHMDVCADRIHEVRSSGGVALVHCALGISRSVTICLAYLVKHEGRTLREAYFELKKKRPIIRPNEGFWRQLISFEIATRGRATVKLSMYPMGAIPDVYRSAPQTVKMRRYNVSDFKTPATGHTCTLRVFYTPQLYRQVLLRHVLAMASLSVRLSVRHDPVQKQPSEIETPGLHHMIA